jgi:hypothetical protein
MSTNYELDLVRLNPLVLRKTTECSLMIDMVTEHMEQVERRIQTLPASSDRGRAEVALQNYGILLRALHARRTHLAEEEASKPDTRVEQRFMFAARAILADDTYREILRQAQDVAGR